MTSASLSGMVPLQVLGTFTGVVPSLASEEVAVIAVGGKDALAVSLVATGCNVVLALAVFEDETGGFLFLSLF